MITIGIDIQNYVELGNVSVASCLLIYIMLMHVFPHCSVVISAEYNQKQRKVVKKSYQGYIPVAFEGGPLRMLIIELTL